MNSKSTFMPDALWRYIEQSWLKEPPILARLREETAHLPEAACQISPDQGQLMTVLTRLIGARRALEIGVFTGYSSIATALGLPDDGELVACDVSEEYTNVARRYWKEAGVDHKIRLMLAPAAETCQRMLDEGQAGTFDCAFIDADKPAYPTYWELTLKLLRPGGMVLVDNVFRDGSVANPDDRDADTIRSFNASLYRDDRVDLALIPIADGLTIARKR